MAKFARLMLAALLAMIGFGGPALAHPHVWVVVKCEVEWTPDGRIGAIKHRWTFDEAYSSYAVQGLDANNDGVYSREELADLAKVNTGSLSNSATSPS